MKKYLILVAIVAMFALVVSGCDTELGHADDDDHDHDGDGVQDHAAEDHDDDEMHEEEENHDDDEHMEE